MALKAPEHVGSDSLQSPHDAEATYHGRKGKGYEVQIAETCVEADDDKTDDDKTDTVNMITHVARSRQKVCKLNEIRRPASTFSWWMFLCS